MPKKSTAKKPKIVSKKVDTDDEEAKEVSVDDVKETEAEIDAEDDAPDEDLPSLGYVTQVAKERYEFRPVLRTQIVYKLPEHRVTSEVMSKFELAEVISIRARQLESSAKVFTDIGDLTDPLAIAKKEIIDKKCPLDIVRMITDKIAERWHVNELSIPPDIL